MTISKDIKFDCAHMLSKYEGKCANLHGHTYHGTVTIEGDVSRKTSMVVDYNTIKEVVDTFDHAVIFSATEERNAAEAELYDWARRYKMRRVELVHGKSTAEVLAKNIAVMLARLPGVKHALVELSETDGSWAIAEASE